MAQFKIETLNGISQSVMFLDPYEKYGGLVNEEEVLIIGGSILEDNGGDKKVQVLELCPINKSPVIFGKKILISIDENIISNDALKEVNDIIKIYPGKIPVLFNVCCDSGKKFYLKLKICALTRTLNL